VGNTEYIGETYIQEIHIHVVLIVFRQIAKNQNLQKMILNTQLQGINHTPYKERRMGKYRTKQPWYVTWQRAKSRCNNTHNEAYKNYGGRGIKFIIDFWEMGRLWFRDGAFFMKQPSIDRIDNDGDYVFENCRFIERGENTRRSNFVRKATYGFKGKKHSEETKMKMSESQRRRYAEAL